MLWMSVGCGLALLNLLTIWHFWLDKRRAGSRQWRIREADLLALAAMGGSPGALFARHLFRHKTRKQPFSSYLWLILAVQAGTAIGFLAG